MQVKKKPRNAAAKKIQKASPKEKRTKKKQNEQPLLKRVIFGEERPDLTELEAGSTTILDILAPTTVDTKSKDYVVVDGVYHTYLYITGYGYATTVGSCWLAPLVRAIMSTDTQSFSTSVARCSSVSGSGAVTSMRVCI